MAQRKLTGKPVIGVTGPDHGGLAAWFFTKLAILRAGGKARRITPSKPYSVKYLHGLIIGGGADVDPKLYGEERALIENLRQEKVSVYRYLLAILFYPFMLLIRKLLSSKKAKSFDSKRDQLENNLIAGALNRKLPILGICRGAQLLNVFLGGSLYQNIQGFYVETPQIRSIYPKKEIRINKNLLMYNIFRKDKIYVNSLHNQAINNVATEFKIAAQELNGVIQAVEHSRYPYIIGVQWHPEYLPQKKEQLRLFSTLVEFASQINKQSSR